MVTIAIFTVGSSMMFMLKYFLTTSKSVRWPLPLQWLFFVGWWGIYSIKRRSLLKFELEVLNYKFRAMSCDFCDLIFGVACNDY